MALRLGAGAPKPPYRLNVKPHQWTCQFPLPRHWLFCELFASHFQADGQMTTSIAARLQVITVIPCSARPCPAPAHSLSSFLFICLSISSPSSPSVRPFSYFSFVLLAPLLLFPSAPSCSSPSLLFYFLSLFHGFL